MAAHTPEAQRCGAGDGLVWHGSSRADWRVGRVLRPRRSGHVWSSRPSVRATEDLLERVRREVAPDALPRRRCVFAVAEDNPLAVALAGGHAAALLGCEAEGRPPERGHVGWWTLVNRALSGRASATAGEVEAWAAAYWLGEPFGTAPADGPETPRAGWELRCERLRVAEVRDPSRGRVGGLEIRTWGVGGDMLLVSAPEGHPSWPSIAALAPGRAAAAGDGLVAVHFANRAGVAADILDALGARAPSPAVGRGRDGGPANGR